MCYWMTFFHTHTHTYKHLYLCVIEWTTHTHTCSHLRVCVIEWTTHTHIHTHTSGCICVIEWTTHTHTHTYIHLHLCFIEWPPPHIHTHISMYVLLNDPYIHVPLSVWICYLWNLLYYVYLPCIFKDFFPKLVYIIYILLRLFYFKLVVYLFF